MSNNFDYTMLSSAEEDLEDIGNYISNSLHNPQAAINLLKKIRSTIEQICIHPFLAKQHENFQLAQQGIRKIPIDNYILCYCVNEEIQQIQILYIKYGKSNLTLADEQI